MYFCCAHLRKFPKKSTSFIKRDYLIHVSTCSINYDHLEQSFALENLLAIQNGLQMDSLLNAPNVL